MTQELIRAKRRVSANVTNAVVPVVDEVVVDEVVVDEVVED